MEQVNTREIDSYKYMCKKYVQESKHGYIQKSVRQTCSKEGIDSGGDYQWGSVREEIPKFSSGE